MADKQNSSVSIHQIRHSAAHITAAAVIKLYPDTKLAIGPVIDDGFYYDVLTPNSIKEEDLAIIQKEAKDLISKNIHFVRSEKKAKEAKNLLKDQPFKLEIIDELEKQGTDIVSFYTCGDFTDLCEGPHVDNSNQIKGFRLLSLAGAYWRGDEKNQMLTRIYGTAFHTDEELEKYLELREQAKLRDHRVIGQKLELFDITPDVGIGMPIWLPNGAKVRKLLEDLVYDLEIQNGYQHVYTPSLGNLNLYKTSGHYPHYSDTMFPEIKVEKETYLLRPMNCPSHIAVYNFKPRSYRDLPLKITEAGQVHRYEKSGELTGLSRVREFTINDSHIFTTEESLKLEIQKTLDQIGQFLDTVGLKPDIYELALHDKTDKKYIKDESMWKKAEDVLREVLTERGVKFREEVGGAAFYGPKIDVFAKDALGREFAISTSQVDFHMPKAFDLNFTNSQGAKERPVIIHRAIIGSFERFFAFLTEHYAGAFPFFLAPVQFQIIPISEKFLTYADEIARVLTSQNYRAQISSSEQTMGESIRSATEAKIPYMIILGQKEQDSQLVSVRSREGAQSNLVTLEAFLQTISK